ncbi:hypothetical protein J437_LFUL008395 [Ladona fulva]|uniref:Transposable element P transposase-like GTP-binding insertion domain-containing protein n=1 Tax=Ladona fulva TaxID=123851 RepID=A0A8K0NZV1_LADFU|nr:hypothetical protein J437_LFUL008395 [Ladona fulva]
MEHFEYNTSLDLIMGYEDHGNNRRSKALANGSQTKSEVLASLMEEVLQQCFMAGLHVIAIVCDMGAIHTIYTIFDPPHLLKATRNLLINHDFVIPVRYDSDKFYGTASWVHIKNAYQHSKGAILHRPLNKLTEDHICPQGAKKMKVKLAAQVMSLSLAVYVEEGCRSGWLPQGALATSAFLGTIDDLFDSMNGGGQMAYYISLS